MSKRVEITINEDGTTEVELFGYQGNGCSDIVDGLSKSLGQSVERNKKCEYYKQEEKTKQKQTTKL